MCEKHIKLFFCVHRREADDTLFVFILTEGSAAFAYDIIQFFRNSMDYIVNLLVPSRFMRKFVCRLRLNEVSRQ